MQARRSELQHGSFADSGSQSHPAGYDSMQFFDSLAVSAPIKMNSSLALTSQDDDFESCKSSLAALFGTATAREEPLANLLFLFRKSSL